MSICPTPKTSISISQTLIHLKSLNRSSVILDLRATNSRGSPSKARRGPIREIIRILTLDRMVISNSSSRNHLEVLELKVV